MFLPEVMQLILYLLVVNLLTFKLRVKAAILRLEFRYLGFRLRQAINRKRKTLSDNIRERNFFQGGSSGFDKTHGYLRTPKITGLPPATLISDSTRPATPVHFFVLHSFYRGKSGHTRKTILKHSSNFSRDLVDLFGDPSCSILFSSWPSSPSSSDPVVHATS